MSSMIEQGILISDNFFNEMIIDTVWLKTEQCLFSYIEGNCFAFPFIKKRSAKDAHAFA